MRVRLDSDAYTTRRCATKIRRWPCAPWTIPSMRIVNCWPTPGPPTAQGRVSADRGRKVAGPISRSPTMTRTQSALAIGGFIVGASLATREIRNRRALDFEDRVVLITGGSRGLGLLMAREFGRLGARVIVAARDEAELQRAQQDLRSQDINATILVADVATESQAHQMVA